VIGELTVGVKEVQGFKYIIIILATNFNGGKKFGVPTGSPPMAGYISCSPLNLRRGLSSV